MPFWVRWQSKSEQDSCTEHVDGVAIGTMGRFRAAVIKGETKMSISTNTDHQEREEEGRMRCQRCESETIPEGLYCIRCGYIPDWRNSNE
jgi:hypothetical protein